MFKSGATHVIVIFFIVLRVSYGTWNNYCTARPPKRDVWSTYEQNSGTDTFECWTDHDGVILSMFVDNENVTAKYTTKTSYHVNYTATRINTASCVVIKSNKEIRGTQYRLHMNEFLYEKALDRVECYRNNDGWSILTLVDNARKRFSDSQKFKNGTNFPIHPVGAALKGYSGLCVTIWGNVTYLSDAFDLRYGPANGGATQTVYNGLHIGCIFIFGFLSSQYLIN
ncbi:b149.13 [miniopterid betaherpesvirus 1]|uniref:B149.13 n=1 Tax=miniopterid betaherpesvirus 1 TaxID=3070189 RepID=I3VQE5_9BETA|nr:b149.13 [miniopterid betaherpesvirus 1]AFK83989.1 b149.13 [miniopterid betaherpesvirus 1]